MHCRRYEQLKKQKSVYFNKKQNFIEAKSALQLNLIKSSYKMKAAKIQTPNLFTVCNILYCILEQL